MNDLKPNQVINETNLKNQTNQINPNNKENKINQTKSFMLTHYQDIQIKSDAEFRPEMLMNILFGELHKSFVLFLASFSKPSKTQTIGISFPAAQNKSQQLGDILRLHGSENHLQLFTHQMKISAGLRDYLNVSDVKIVPEKTNGFYVVSRKQSDSNPERLRRRLIKRQAKNGSSSQEEAQKRIPNEAAKMLNLPYIQMKSKSTQQHFLLFIEQKIVKEAIQINTGFSTYGLSSGTCVPRF